MEGNYSEERYYNDLKNYNVFFVYDQHEHKSGVILGYESLCHKIEVMDKIGLTPAATIEAYMWDKSPKARRGDLCNGKVFLVADAFPQFFTFNTVHEHHISACDGCEVECDICPYFECVGCKLDG